MTIKIYNTLTRKKEAFETIEPGTVRMYVCGPTVYAPAHIGHAMSAMVFDIIRRYLEFRGYEVRHVVNYTDVDDKIIDRANKEGQDPFDLAEKHIQAYAQSLEELNIEPATVFPRASQEMDQIKGMISQLIDAGVAYAINGDVYYRVESKEDYGKLSGRKLETMNAGYRIQVDDKKEHPMDFALWKAAKEGEPAWESPWGLGRPGWHIECSAMNLHHLGEQIDIHGGGNDLIFPHHENEIAQTEAITHKTFARYWIHNGMLVLKGEKMSKSLGNLVTIDEFLSKYPGNILRLMVINTGYRSPLTFNDEVLEQTENAYARLLSALKPALANAAGLSQEADQYLNDQLTKARSNFIDAMDDDFNTSAAIAVLFDLVRIINQARSEGATESQLEPAQAAFSELMKVLGFKLEIETQTNSNADPFIELLIALRTELRTQKLFALSDKIRNDLKALGVIIEDSKDGTSWHWE